MRSARIAIVAAVAVLVVVAALPASARIRTDDGGGGGGGTFTPPTNPLGTTSTPGSATFGCADGAVNWVVPSGVTSLSAVATGASGRADSTGSHLGGFGAKVTGSVTVTPGETLHVRVGCSDGFNGGGSGFVSPDIGTGGNGGGATDLRRGGDAFANRVMTAAGGGGGGQEGAGGSASGATGGNGTGGLNDGIGATLTDGGWRGGRLGFGGDGELMVFGGGGGGGVYGGGGSGEFDFGDLQKDPVTSPGGGGGAGSSAGGTIQQAAARGDGSLALSWVAVVANIAPTKTTIDTTPILFSPSGDISVLVNVSRTDVPGLKGYGTVTLDDGTGESDPVSVTQGGQAFFAAGPYDSAPTFTARFTGLSGYGDSSATLTMDPVPAAATATALSVSPNPSEIGGTFGATATVTSGGDPVSTGSVTFSGYGPDQIVAVGSDGTASALFTSTPLGGGTVTATYTPGAGYLGSADSAPHSVVDGSAPTVTVTAPLVPSSGWYTGSVTAVVGATDDDQIATLSCSPSNSSPTGLGSPAAAASATAAAEGTTTISCTATDRSGNPGGATATVKIDSLAPTVSWSGGPADGSKQPFGAVAAAPACTAVDGGSGPKGCSVTGWSNALGSHTLVATASDQAGNVTTAERTYTVADDVRPTLRITLPPIPGNGWFHGAVTAIVGATDNDAVASLGCTPASSAPTGIGSGSAAASVTATAQGPTTLSCTSTDRSGNTATALVRVWIDSVAPGFGWSGSIANGASYLFGSVPATPRCAATDGGSGPAGCTVTGWSAAVGAHTLTATATDTSGNRTVRTRSYTVKPWTLHGFAFAAKGSKQVNTVKAGSTFALMFDVFAGAKRITKPGDVTMTATLVKCPAGLAGAPFNSARLGGQTFFYEPVLHVFIYNWKAPTAKGVCTSVKATARDGSSIVALFRTT